MKGIPRLVGYVLTVSFFTLLITSIFATQIQPAYAQVNIKTKDKTTNSNSMQNDFSLIAKILAKNLENRLQKAGALLGITSALPQVRNVSYAHFLNQTLDTLHGIPKDADIQKRQVAQSILSKYKDLQIIIFIMPNGDIYFDEPYYRQQASITTNLAFRDYFKGVIRTNDTYLGDPTPSASSGQMQSVIAIPVYSLKDNSTIVGVWAGGINFNVLNKELQSLNITSLDNKVQVSLVAFKLENEGFTSIRQRLEDAGFTNGTNKENYESYNENGENKVARALSMLLEKNLYNMIMSSVDM